MPWLTWFGLGSTQEQAPQTTLTGVTGNVTATTGTAGGGGQGQAGIAGLGALQAQQNTLGNLQYQTIIRNPFADDFGGNPWGTHQQQMQQNWYVAPPIRRRDPTEIIYQMGNDWITEGMEFTEMVVSRRTYDRLALQIIAQARMYDHREMPVEPGRQDIIINTAMGPVKIICEERKPTFDLSKYMETVG